MAKNHRPDNALALIRVSPGALRPVKDQDPTTRFGPWRSQIAAADIQREASPSIDEDRWTARSPRTTVAFNLYPGAALAGRQSVLLRLTACPSL
jgi:hypothetical protein